MVASPDPRPQTHEAPAPPGAAPAASALHPVDSPLSLLDAPDAVRRRRLRERLERVAEVAIWATSFTAIAVILLIFLFVGREALPVILQRSSTARIDAGIDPATAATLPREQLAAFLGMKPADLDGVDAETIQYLVQEKTSELSKSGSDPDAKLNSASYREMLLPRAWRGYEKPAYVWQPESPVPKFNIVPLIVGSLKCTTIALLFAVPLSLLAAVFVSQYAPRTARQIIKPCIEMLAGIPSVVLGSFALLILATWLQGVLGYETRLNALVAGIALGLAVVPVVFTIADDALRAVPKSYYEAAIALGASKFDVIVRVIIPAAAPGLFAAVVLGFGRAIGETMVVLIASGNAWIIDASPVSSARTITASIAAELAETVRGGVHYRVLFFLGALLFVFTFITNWVGATVISRMRAKMMGTRR